MTDHPMATNSPAIRTSRIARLLALPAAYRHRKELLALTPEQRADFGMCEAMHRKAIETPVTKLPDYACACARWQGKLDRGAALVFGDIRSWCPTPRLLLTMQKTSGAKSIARFFSPAAALIATALLYSPASGEPRDEIEAMYDAYAAAFDAGDPAGIAELYREDAVYLAPGWRVMSGRDGVETLYTAFLKAGFTNLRTEIQSFMQLDDDTIVTVTHDYSQRTNASGGATDHAYKSMAVWQMSADGCWQILSMTFSDLPN